MVQSSDHYNINRLKDNRKIMLECGSQLNIYLISVNPGQSATDMKQSVQICKVRSYQISTDHTMSTSQNTQSLNNTMYVYSNQSDNAYKGLLNSVRTHLPYSGVFCPVYHPKSSPSQEFLVYYHPIVGI